MKSVRRRRIAEVGVVLATLAILPATVLMLWLSGWYATLGMSRAVAGEVGRIEGRVWKVEPTTGAVEVASQPFGLGAIRVVVTGATRVVVGAKEGALADLHEGMRVVVVYEHHAAVPVASVIELVDARIPRHPAASSTVDRLLKTAASE